MMNSVARPRRLLLALHLASVALVTVQQAILGHSNNLSIFRSASLNLFAGRDLYAAHPEQHFDFYKYSPTFALLFAPLAYLPFALAFLCWALLNGLLLWYALDRLLPEREATVALALLYLEVLLALQYGQSNALVAALMILAFVALERRHQLGAASSITGGAAVKLFPLAALSLAILYPRRLRFAAIFSAALAVAVLFNHASESPSFIVAYTGIVIWYASSPPSRLRTAIMALTLLVMVVHDVDVVPRWVKYDILVPYRIKGIPCLVAWFVMQWELFFGSFPAPRSTVDA